MVIDIDIEIKRHITYCDECNEDVLLIEGLYNGEVKYSMCNHDVTDIDNNIEDVIASAVDIVEHEQAQDQ